jgi:endonuclease/exonuclease/phosphatase family metal-dependent hydrolase
MLLLVLSVSAAPLAAAQTPVRIVTYNIRHGEGMDGTVDLERIAAALRSLDADVIALQEVDRRTERTGGVDQTARLAELLRMRGFFGAHRSFQGGEYGVTILSRVPVLDVRTHPMPASAGNDLAVLEVVLGVGSHRLSTVSVHLAGSPEERRAQADSLTRIYSEAEGPVILAGDFNARRGSQVMEVLGRDWRILDKEGDPETYPSDDPNREIDFVLLRPPGAFEVVAHHVVDETLASDHRPIVVDVRIW